MPERSALRFIVRFPVISQSGAMSPSPRPLTGSLLVSEVMLQTGVAVQLSVALAVTATATILWSGGQSIAGFTDVLFIVGGGYSQPRSRSLCIDLRDLDC